MSYSDAARLLHVSRQTIYAMIDRGELHPLEIAERRYLLREEVEGLKNQRAPVSEGAPTSKIGGEKR
jgi:excisionase family DNA binding protein